jgi:hypothetical protein
MLDEPTDGFSSEQLERVRDVLRELPQLVWHQDEPISEPAAIPAFLVTQLARQTVNGELEQNYDAEFDYKTTLKELARGFQPHQVEQMTAVRRQMVAGLSGIQLAPAGTKLPPMPGAPR